MLSVLLDFQPGYQWDDAGGYCGSWAVQRAALGKGAWISQQQVRDHTSPGGGHDNEILSTNIEEAFKKLKISFEGFDYVNEPLPQQDAYARWLKKQLVAGYAVAWMIMWSGQSYPIYDLKPPAGMYGHVEPVVGIQSNHPLNDTTRGSSGSDDVVLHYTDAGTNTVHRALSSLGGSWAGPGRRANCGWRHSYCMAEYAFGWAVKGFEDDKPYVQASLAIQPYESEPDTRSGETPVLLKGTLTVTELTAGSTYSIYRWDSVEDAFTYSDSFKKTSFQAKTDRFVYSDGTGFQSSGTTYYRVLLEAAAEEAV
ncbi:unnamed protein product, partial [Prorocentrum cordatum]